MNVFDVIVVALTLLAVVFGYRAGLLRSLATIFGYVLAAPVAVVAAPMLGPHLPTPFRSIAETGISFLLVLLAAGLLMAALLRGGVNLIFGESVSVPDRLAGAALGAVRILLLAVLMVLVFDYIIPARKQPAWLAQSQLRPLFLTAAQRGVRSLPPDVTAHIDRLKKERGI